MNGWLGFWLPIVLMLGGITAILIWALLNQDRDYRRHSPTEQQENEDIE